jgi:hypothetical protein
MSATWRHGRLMHLSKLTYVMAEGLVQIAPQPGPHCPPLYEERCPDCVQAVLALAGATAGGSACVCLKALWQWWRAHRAGLLAT